MLNAWFWQQPTTVNSVFCKQLIRSVGHLNICGAHFLWAEFSVYIFLFGVFDFAFSPYLFRWCHFVGFRIYTRALSQQFICRCVCRICLSVFFFNQQRNLLANSLQPINRVIKSSFEIDRWLLCVCYVCVKTTEGRNILLIAYAVYVFVFFILAAPLLAFVTESNSWITNHLKIPILPFQLARFNCKYIYKVKRTSS